MAQWTYELTWAESQNRGIPKEKSSVAFTIKRTSPASVDTSLYKLSSTTGSFSSDSSVKTYTSFALNFGGYGTSSTISSNSSTHAISGSVTGLASSLLSVGTSGQSISVSVSGKSSDTYNYIFFYGTKFTITINVTDKYEMSTISASSVNFGSNSVVNISNPNLSELNHYVTWTITGDGKTYTGSQSTGAGVSQASCLMNNSWMDAVPYATSISCTIRVVTKKGNTTIGTYRETTITVSVPASVKPSIGSASATVYNPVSGFSGRYIQNKTGVVITLSNVIQGAGSTIPVNGFSIRMSKSESASFNFSNFQYTINTLKNSGSNTFYISVKDGRGRSSNEVSVTISVEGYAAPTVIATTAYRVNANGVSDENGTYANISITADYSAITGNSMTINSKYYVASGTKTTAQNNMVSGRTYKIGGGNLSPSNTYYIDFIVKDTVGGDADAQTITIVVQTAPYVMHVQYGGVGVAFGKTSEIPNSVEINQGWNLYYKGHIVAPVVYGTSAPSNPTVGMVWIKPKT